MISISKGIPLQLRPEQIFLLSGLVVNAGNYLYNLILGRILGPAQFADAALMITLLLVLSFVAMTFQLTAARFASTMNNGDKLHFSRWLYSISIVIGITLGLGMVVFSNSLHQVFNTQDSTMFIVFGLALPFYFIMSVNRGLYQGEEKFISLSITYQLEMFFRLLITLVALYVLNIQSSTGVALGIAFSMIAGLFPFKRIGIKLSVNKVLKLPRKKQVVRFLWISAIYEGTLIVCNNSDILLVKHYFDNLNAGMYSSLALIGRIVYYVTWMFVMILLPKVVQAKQAGTDTRPLMFGYLKYIIALCSGIVLFTFLFPEFSVRVLFGQEFVSIAPLLGWYAVATGLFAISNVFVYYFLSLDHFVPIFLSTAMGIVQVILIVCWHNDLSQVVAMQVISMLLLFLFQLGYYLRNSKTAA